jgi:ABC-type transporter Mla subunit MlaD
MAEITIRVSDKSLRIAGIVLGGVFLTVILFYLWSSGVFASKYQVRAYAPELSGLGTNAQVTLDGVRVGSVAAINLTGESGSSRRRLELVMRIQKRYQNAIRTDSTASLATRGLLGGRYVNISRGFKGSIISADGEIKFAPEYAFTDLLNSIQKMANCVKAETGPGKGSTDAIPNASYKPQTEESRR